MLALKRKLMLESQRKREEEEEEGGEGEEEVMFCVHFVISDSFFLFLSPPFLFSFTVSFLFSFFSPPLSYNVEYGSNRYHSSSLASDRLNSVC